MYANYVKFYRKFTINPNFISVVSRILSQIILHKKIIANRSFNKHNKHPMI